MDKKFIPVASFCLFKVKVPFGTKFNEIYIFNEVSYCFVQPGQQKDFGPGDFKNLAFNVADYILPKVLYPCIPAIHGPVYNALLQWIANNGGDCGSAGFGQGKFGFYQLPALKQLEPQELTQHLETLRLDAPSGFK